MVPNHLILKKTLISCWFPWFYYATVSLKNEDGSNNVLTWRVKRKILKSILTARIRTILTGTFKTTNPSHTYTKQDLKGTPQYISWMTDSQRYHLNLYLSNILNQNSPETCKIMLYFFFIFFHAWNQ